MDRLDEIEARRAITELFFAYAYHFDRNEPSLVAALFTEDAVVDYGPEVAPAWGRAAIESRIAAGLREVFVATSHHISNVVITFDDGDGAHRSDSGESAGGVAYLYAWHRYRDGSPDGHLWGQYHNRFRRTHDGWHIAALQLRAAGTSSFHRHTMHPIGRRP